MIYRVDAGFDAREINPFTGAPYDHTWAVFSLTDSTDYEAFSGGHPSTYSLKVSKNNPHWAMAVCDFAQYQQAMGKNVILSLAPADWEEANARYQNHSYRDRFLREYEPKVLVHSTTQANWQGIKRDGCLKSWRALKKERADWEREPIGGVLGDPPDFSDYIMFSDGNVSGEIVVLSKMRGEITMDQDMEYPTGARLYFDLERIAQDGLLTRDGAHLKVKDALPLAPYLLWTAQWDSVGLPSPRSTPKQFTQMANDAFNRLYGLTGKAVIG